MKRVLKSFELTESGLGVGHTFVWLKVRGAGHLATWLVSERGNLARLNCSRKLRGAASQAAGILYAARDLKKDIG